MAILTQHPYIDQDGNEYPNLIKTYSSEGYQIIQLSTGNIYEEAVDIYPTTQRYEEYYPEEEIEEQEPTEEGTEEE